MKILLLILTLVLSADTGQAQEIPAWVNTPLNLRVMVRYSREKDDPARAAYLYRKLREVPNVTLVQEGAEYFLDVNTFTKNGVLIMQFVVLKPATPTFRRVVSDRVETRLRMQNVAAWQEAGNLIREEVAKYPGAFFYEGLERLAVE